MSTGLPTRLIAVAAVCGVVVAVALALLLPERSVRGEAADGALPSDPAATASLAQPPSPAQLDPRKPATAAARPDPRGLGWVQLSARGAVRVAARAEDPRGGPPWVVRSFSGRAAWRDADGGRGEADWGRCLQLGRLLGGRFGWIDAANIFRPVGIQQRGAPLRCALGGTLDPGEQELTRVRISADGRAQPLQSVEWGLRRDGQVSLRALRGVAPVGAQGRVEYRVPDPSGGLPWGVTAVRRNGGWCASGPANVVGDRLGRVDFRLGIIDTTTSAMLSVVCNQRTAAPTRAQPLRLIIVTGAGAANQDDPGLAARRSARRTLAGSMTISGVADPSVRSITISTPRDTRTVIPSARAGAFLVVYDDSFPTGQIVVVATRHDGSTIRQEYSGR